MTESEKVKALWDKCSVGERLVWLGKTFSMYDPSDASVPSHKLRIDYLMWLESDKCPKGK